MESTAEIRARQGLPAKIEDPEMLARLAAIFGPALDRLAAKAAAAAPR
jgi:hypothetical protein